MSKALLSVSIVIFGIIVLTLVLWLKPNENSYNPNIYIRTKDNMGSSATCLHQEVQVHINKDTTRIQHATTQKSQEMANNSLKRAINNAQPIKAQNINKSINNSPSEHDINVEKRDITMQELYEITKKISVGEPVDNQKAIILCNQFIDFVNKKVVTREEALGTLEFIKQTNPDISNEIDIITQKINGK